MSGTPGTTRLLRRGARTALVAGLGLAIGLGACLSVPAEAARQPAAATAEPPVPLLAYYYIWFDPSSWNRAKSDYPLLGRYSSDDEAVMRTHVRWAKAAGITGFIVSWKRTDVLDRRLGRLIRVADSEDFKLAIIYEGLDFYRRPLPVTRVAGDLRYFAARYARDPAFDLFGKPLVIWSGTWRFAPAEIDSVARPLRPELLVLASERKTRRYQRIGGLVDGNAYYWSSVDPETNENHTAKLNEMAALVHANRGLWIAPAAPGFDSRKLGGKTVVDRRGGATLRRQLDAALGSSPDAIGLISWNEFSESSHIEPSRQFGSLYLHLLADLRRSAAGGLPELDSSEPAGRARRPMTLVGVGLGFVLVVASALLVIGRRSRGRR